jgi:hypothetical protein
MFKPQQYRARAAEYGELIKRSTGRDEIRRFQELQDRVASLADNEQGLRTTMTMQCRWRTRTDRTAWFLRSKRNSSCGVLPQPSSCNGTPCRRRCNGSSSTPPGRSESCCRRRRFVAKSPDFYTSTRMMPVAANCL